MKVVLWNVGGSDGCRCQDLSANEWLVTVTVIQLKTIILYSGLLDAGPGVAGPELQ